MTTLRMLVALAATASLMQAAPAAAQTAFGLEVGGAGYNARHRVQLNGATNELTGFWYGGQGRARLGPTFIEVRGLTGSLGGTSTLTNPERTVRVTSVAAGLAVTPWLQVGGAMEAWHFDASGLPAVWKLLGLTARVTPSFGIRSLNGVVEVRYFPSASLSGDQKMSMALQTQLGVEFAVPNSGIVLNVGYRVERYDFTATGAGAARLEQVSGLTAGLGYRLGR
jgi:hypothetical protein